MTGWSSDKRIARDGAVGSSQQIVTDRPVVPATEDGALALGRVYWDAVETFSRPFVAVHRGKDGGIDIRALAGPAFLRLGAPEVSVGTDGVCCRYPIEGGILTREAGGVISFLQKEGEEGVTLRSMIDGYRPALAARPGRPGWTGALYTLGQARLHAALSRRYFDRLLREPT